LLTACRRRDSDIVTTHNSISLGRGGGGGGGGGGDNGMNLPKKPRLVFTDIQRRTLLAIFKESKRPNKEVQSTIAAQLGLKVSTVANFFMNARRRSLEKYMEERTSPASLREGGGGGGGGHRINSNNNNNINNNNNLSVHTGGGSHQL